MLVRTQGKGKYILPTYRLSLLACVGCVMLNASVKFSLEKKSCGKIDRRFYYSSMELLDFNVHFQMAFYDRIECR